jgi:hypothetical protein
MQRYANSIAILQCTSSANITAIIIIANRIRQNVFVHMQRHVSEEKKKELIFRVYCLCTQDRFITSCIDQSIAEV